MARTIVTSEMIKQINERYYELKNKSAVAREIGISPSTVTNYLIEGYVPDAELLVTEIDMKVFRKHIANFLLKQEDFDNVDLLKHTSEEEEEIRELWGEMNV